MDSEKRKRLQEEIRLLMARNPDMFKEALKRSQERERRTEESKEVSYECLHARFTI